jgi:hypothetical protein
MKVLKKTGLLVVVAAALSALAAGNANASAVYTYTGNNYTDLFDDPVPSGNYTAAMGVSGSFTLASPLAANLVWLSTESFITSDVVSFSFFDGRNTLTNLNTSFSQFEVSTDATGAIVEWSITLDSPHGTTDGDQFFEIVTQGPAAGENDFGSTGQCVASLDPTCGVFYADTAHTYDNPGIWSAATIESATPLPAALPLFATGLGAFGLLSWRRKRKNVGARSPA